MRYRILCVGRRARDPLLDAADDYLKRLNHFVPAELHRIRPEAGADRLVGALGPKDHVVALDPRGRELDTPALVERVRAWSQRVPEVTWIIGGADGVPAAAIQRANEKLSLSQLTLPHRLALVVLLEQLYRVHAIVRGVPYHH